jgi:hypothetical protein
LNQFRSIDQIYAQCEQESFIPQCEEVIHTLQAAIVDFEKVRLNQRVDFIVDFIILGEAWLYLQLITRLKVQEPVERQLFEICNSESSASRPRPPPLAWEVRKSSMLSDSDLGALIHACLTLSICC